MTTWNRHSGAPYQDGETLEAADLELDIANGASVVNGNIDNANVKTAAAIEASKLKDNDITATQIAASVVTTAELAASAVPKAYVSTSSGAANFGAGTTWADVNDITAGTLAAGASGDFVEVECQITVDKTALGANNTITFGFEVASGTAAATATGVAQQMFDQVDDDELIQTVTWIHSFTATAAENITVIPQVMGNVAGTSATLAYSTDVLRVFRARILPIK